MHCEWHCEKEEEELEEHAFFRYAIISSHVASRDTDDFRRSGIFVFSISKSSLN